MSIRTTARLPEELYEKATSYVKYNDVKSLNDLFILSLESYLCDSPSKVIYSEDSMNENKNLKLLLEDSRKQWDVLIEQLKTKDEQLKVKDYQISSLISIQKDILEKTKETKEQVKLLSDHIQCKKWYQFWK